MEMKVGALMALSVVILIGFIMVMGGLSLQPTFRLFVEFENPGGLQTGSPVRIAGLRIGRIQAIEFRKPKPQEADKRDNPAVVISLAIESKYQDAIHDDATFFVTAQGVLGEMHLAIDPGTPSRPLMPADSTVLGISPPRLDQLLGEGYELMHRAYQGSVSREKQIGETLDNVHRTLRGTARLFDEHEQDISRLIQRSESIAERAEELIANVEEQYVTGPRIERILTRLDHITLVLDQNLEPMLKESRTVLADGAAVAHVLAEPEQLETIRLAAKDTRYILGTARTATDDVKAILQKVKAGRGTAGSLLMDEALYDDLQELVRDLKQNPWKLLWKD
jgi:phospholipid/cholesterol/gamma-HCH transport system substrate-binding protein